MVNPLSAWKQLRSSFRKFRVLILVTVISVFLFWYLITTPRDKNKATNSTKGNSQDVHSMLAVG
jgi:hypothetical protein